MCPLARRSTRRHMSLSSSLLGSHPGWKLDQFSSAPEKLIIFNECILQADVQSSTGKFVRYITSPVRILGYGYTELSEEAQHTPGKFAPGFLTVSLRAVSYLRKFTDLPANRFTAQHYDT